LTPRRRKEGEPFPLLVQGGDTYESLDEAMAAGLPILGKIIADLARKEWQEQTEQEHGQEKEGVAVLSGADGGSALPSSGDNRELSPSSPDT